MIAKVKRFFETSDVEFAPEHMVEDNSPLPGGDVMTLDANGSRSEERREFLNSILPEGYEIVAVEGGWRLNRHGAVVDYYDGMWI